MKRFTYWPQIFLGLAFSWGALMGWAAMFGRLDLPAFLLYAGSIAWVIHYDTIYAHQDREDDALVGLKSTALLFGARTKPALALFSALAVVLIGLAGWTAGAGIVFAIGLAAFAAHLAWQVCRIDIADPVLCLRLFKSNRDAGLILFAALILDAVVKRAIYRHKTPPTIDAQPPDPVTQIAQFSPSIFALDGLKGLSTVRDHALKRGAGSGGGHPPDGDWNEAARSRCRDRRRCVCACGSGEGQEGTQAVVDRGQRMEASLRKLDPDTRFDQVCDMAAMRRPSPANSAPYKPDRAVSSAVSQPAIKGDEMTGSGGAFRSKGKWYQFSFTCSATSDRMKVQNFTYKIGEEIPESKWDGYGLWR